MAICKTIYFQKKLTANKVTLTELILRYEARTVSLEQDDLEIIKIMSSVYSQL